jgi:hypothetical protein
MACTTKEPKMITSSLTASHADARATELQRRAAAHRRVAESRPHPTSRLSARPPRFIRRIAGAYQWAS